MGDDLGVGFADDIAVGILAEGLQSRLVDQADFAVEVDEDDPCHDALKSALQLLGALPQLNVNLRPRNDGGRLAGEDFQDASVFFRERQTPSLVSDC